MRETFLGFLRSWQRGFLLGCVLTAVVCLVILPTLAGDSAPAGKPNIRLEPAPPALAFGDQENAPDSDLRERYSGDKADRQRLSTLRGPLAWCGDRYCINGTILDFGPSWYLTSTRAPANFDGDSDVATLGEEIRGLVGSPIVVRVRLGHRGEADVFAIDGIFYRDPQEPPPWAGPPPWVPGPPGRAPRESPAERTEDDRSGGKPEGRPQSSSPPARGNRPSWAGQGQAAHAEMKAGQGDPGAAPAFAPRAPGAGAPDRVPVAGVPFGGPP